MVIETNRAVDAVVILDDEYSRRFGNTSIVNDSLRKALGTKADDIDLLSKAYPSQLQKNLSQFNKLKPIKNIIAIIDPSHGENGQINILLTALTVIFQACPEAKVKVGILTAHPIDAQAMFETNLRKLKAFTKDQLTKIEDFKDLAELTNKLSSQNLIACMGGWDLSTDKLKRFIQEAVKQFTHSAN